MKKVIGNCAFLIAVSIAPALVSVAPRQEPAGQGVECDARVRNATCRPSVGQADPFDCREIEFTAHQDGLDNVKRADRDPFSCGDLPMFMGCAGPTELPILQEYACVVDVPWVPFL